jgi:hypothetical protein
MRRTVHPDSAESLFMKGVVERRMGNVCTGDTDSAAAATIASRMQKNYTQFGILP